MREKKISEPPVYEKGSNETTLDPPLKWSVNAFKMNQDPDPGFAKSRPKPDQVTNQEFVCQKFEEE